jgi:probable HAF family extracellular repeat protein
MKRFIVYCCVALAIAGQGEAASFHGLGQLPGMRGYGGGFSPAISDDGNVIVGSIDEEVFRWTAHLGLELLGDLPGGEIRGEAGGVSNNGVIVGSGRTVTNSGVSITPAARWTELTGWQAITAGEFAVDPANDVSADGQVIVGSVNLGGTTHEAFRWTEATGAISLGDLPGGIRNRSARGISADGGVIVGVAQITMAGFLEAFRWTEATGMVGLGDLPGGAFGSSAFDISANGLVIVGTSTVADDPPRDTGFRWTQETGMVRIDRPPNDTSSFSYFQPKAVSGDGSIIVGGRHIWDSVNGTRFLSEVLVHDYGLANDLAGWTALDASGISADGRVIVGTGINADGLREGWIARLDESTSPPQPPGNFNGDIRVDTADYVAWRDGLGATHTQSDYDAWKANFGKQRPAGVVGTPITSIELSATNELQSFVAGGTSYSQDDLIQPTLAEFAGNPETSGNILVRAGDSVPSPGNRSELLTSDFRLDTGIVSPAVGPTSATLAFSTPLVNGPGPDFVVFQFDANTNFYGSEVFQLQVDSTTGIVLELSWGEALLTTDVTVYSRNGGVPTTITQLENDNFSNVGTGRAPLVGLAVDLDELGVSPLAEISTIQFGTLATHPRQYFLPVLFMGINSVSALAGDFNRDGAVDVTDYLVWRDGLGTTFTQADYDAWRAQFGQTVASNSLSAGTPEPTTAAFAVLAIAFAGIYRASFRRHANFNVSQSSRRCACRHGRRQCAICRRGSRQ